MELFPNLSALDTCDQANSMNSRGVKFLKTPNDTHGLITLFANRAGLPSLSFCATNNAVALLPSYIFAREMLCTF